MPAFETLLRRFRERTSLGEEHRVLATFQARSEPSAQSAWRAWAEAQRAFHLGSPRLGLAWLAAARDCRPDAGDALLTAELLSAETSGWLWLDEPREAAGPAHHAWRAWLEIARDPRPEAIVGPARQLLGVLSEPHPPPELSDEQVHAAWLQDRLVPQFQSAPTSLLGILADLRQIEAADEVAREFKSWVDQYVTQTFGPMSGLIVADFQLGLGDVYDRCGDSERALVAFQEGIRRLEGMPSHDEIDWKRARLRFNSANQLASLDRQDEALAGFVAAEETFSRLDAGEALLRARFGIVMAEFSLGARAGLEDRLSVLAAAYEAALAEAASGGIQLATRQGLDKVYRLWLRISAERIETGEPLEALLFFHLLFALKEEDGKFNQVWQAARERPDAELLTEISVMVDRLDQRSDATLLVVEQGAGAVVFTSLRPGREPWHTRVAIQVMHAAEVGALTDLIRAQRDTVDQMAGRSLDVDAAPSPSFVDVCGRAWTSLRPEIRGAIDAAETLFVTLDNQTQLDELPIELFHDGTTYLGLRTHVLRAPSLNELNVFLGENGANAAGAQRAVLVRAQDDLPAARLEAERVEARLQELGMAVSLEAAPEPRGLLTTLGSGTDLMHYVGHGLADEIGEELPLGGDRRLTARDIGAIGPAPAPVAILSACLAGRARQLRTGHQHGFVPAFVGAGSPAVLAAKYLVGDEFAVEYTELLYFFLQRQSLPAAVQATRRVLADDGYHPAAWSLFVLYGRSDIRLQRPHACDARTWPSATLRYLATGAEAYRELALRLLERDERLTEEARAGMARDLSALAGGVEGYFHDTVMKEPRELHGFAEAMIVSNVVRAFGRIRHGTETDPARRARTAEALIGHALEITRILSDAYLLVAVAVEMRERTMLHLHGEGRVAFRHARTKLRWLSADEAALTHARSVLAPKEE